MTSNELGDTEADEIWKGVSFFTPEDNGTFRHARMLLFLSVAKRTGRSVQSLDRLGYYEFFADSPYIVIEGDKPRDLADRAALEVAGFTRVQLSYASSGARFMSRRRRLRDDLAQLIAYGLVELTGVGYGITTAGRTIANALRSLYADAYMQSAEIVLRRLSAKSNTALERSVEEWLGHSWLLVDLLDDVTDAEAPRDEILVDKTREDDADEAEGEELS